LDTPSKIPVKLRLTAETAERLRETAHRKRVSKCELVESIIRDQLDVPPRKKPRREAAHA
jgi:hypothetical protein